MSASAILKSAKGTPNVGLWGRDASDRKTGMVTGDKYNTLFGLHQKFIGLDIEVTNSGGAVATFTLDGISYSLTAGQIKSISNHPFIALEATSATALDVAIDGILYDTLVDLGLIDRLQEGLSTWR
jgi:hypothetical protein